MRLSNAGYYADFYISAALIALQFVFVLPQAAWPQLLEWITYCLLGAAAWTLLEYAVHRWLYHKAAYFKDLHAAHHAEPNAHIGAPPVIGIVLIVAISFTPMVFTSFHAACGITTGMLLGYLAYMGVHHAAHHLNPSPDTWLHYLRRHHALHHHKSGDTNFGITTAFWDHVFGTAWAAPTSRSRAAV